MERFVASPISTETFGWIMTVDPSIVNNYFDHGKSLQRETTQASQQEQVVSSRIKFVIWFGTIPLRQHLHSENIK